MEIERLKFLTEEETRSIAKEFGTPVFVYSQKEIESRCDIALAFPNEYGLTVRYAMKANPNNAILKIMKKKGIHIDASSGFEVERALLAGFKPSEIMLTSQELPSNLKEIVERGTMFNACSLHQLESFGKLFPNQEVSVRINPGLGSGATQKTDVGGTTSAFGIWHEYIEDVKKIKEKYGLKITKVHTHIGSGSDPEVWKAVSKYTLLYAEIFTEATTVNLGGGFKVGRMLEEKTTDLQKIGQPVKELFIEFNQKHGRKLKLEIEPGTHMIALCGSIITKVMDKVDTGKNGFEFIKLDTGMDSNTRPSLYGSRHPLITVTANGSLPQKTKNYVVVGHCCESGDLFTQKEGGSPETREMMEANIGDLVVMEGTGAYCSGMSTKNYNSYPETPEVLIKSDGQKVLIRKKQELKQIFENEIEIAV
ncbi:MAG TPA: diaminopimelate decarboxylase [Leptospiraceae bacterium]|nr:diaminopimelate decarboxylase [Leptospiraceae bacterium]HMW04847.1 diaminopimelate decarboxylase [Leptospiraceae bacterium]HMX34734.1 diaminopimelate decarboxylase [Leptospiraceae bacterium]HMY30405.1 diaminopimelate decarboxylase [Leptospiraceae bacterium]HMZ64639.1 diaminopimelate decarboxylase [Leptospiraceae bacterium]